MLSVLLVVIVVLVVEAVGDHLLEHQIRLAETDPSATPGRHHHHAEGVSRCRRWHIEGEPAITDVAGGRTAPFVLHRLPVGTLLAGVVGEPGPVEVAGVLDNTTVEVGAEVDDPIDGFGRLMAPHTPSSRGSRWGCRSRRGCRSGRSCCRPHRVGTHPVGPVPGTKETNLTKEGCVLRPARDFFVFFVSFVT